MQKNLLDSVSARLEELGSGGYARVYRSVSGEYPSSLHLLVAQILEAAGVRFATDVAVLTGSSLKADFAIGDRLIFLGDGPLAKDRKRLEAEGKRCTVLSRASWRSDVFDTGVRSESGRTRDGRLQTIFLDDPAFNFDYAHILPRTEKCSVMHGHTSSALVELIGAPRDGMVVDFNDAKPIIKDAIAGLDHKLFISSRYVVKRNRDRVSIAFETVHGPFEMSVPAKTTVLLEGEATVENLAQELLRRIVPSMPTNVEAVGVYVYEGLNKGTHLLAQVHSREAERRRTR